MPQVCAALGRSCGAIWQAVLNIWAYRWTKGKQVICIHNSLQGTGCSLVLEELIRCVLH